MDWINGIEEVGDRERGLRRDQCHKLIARAMIHSFSLGARYDPKPTLIYTNGVEFGRFCLPTRLTLTTPKSQAVREERTSYNGMHESQKQSIFITSSQYRNFETSIPQHGYHITSIVRLSGIAFYSRKLSAKQLGLVYCKRKHMRIYLSINLTFSSKQLEADSGLFFRDLEA